MSVLKYLTRLPATLILLLSLFSTAQSQMWVQKNEIFNPSGIPSAAFSQPRFADLDADGDQDLLLGNLSNQPFYYENTGTPVNPQFTNRSELISMISELDAEIVVAVDLDGDSDLDLVAGGYTGLNYYNNTGDINNPQFVKIAGVFNHLQVGMNPIPSFADIDADNDFDLLVGYSEDGMIKLYYNTGTSEAMEFEESGSIQLFDVGLYAYASFSDFDLDGDYDILTGRDGLGFYYYKNIGDPQNADWEQQNSLFSNLGMDTYFNSPDLVDIDGDSEFEFIYGTADGPIKYFNNTGTADDPAWNENTSLFGGVLDTGGASSPFFYDFDDDGDLDLISGSQLGNIKYFENTGTTSSPAWEENNSYFSSVDHSIYSAVTVGDINNDTLPDILAGDLSGNLYLHLNTGSGFVYSIDSFDDVNLGGFSAPKFADIDFDEDLDIIAGNEDGAIFFFRNTGTISEPFWEEIPGYFGSVETSGNCVPALVDLDMDGDIDLAVGNLWGEIDFYTNSTREWIQNNEVLEGITCDQNATPAFADLDGDGDQDMIIGNYEGTFDYYENTTLTSVNNHRIATNNEGISMSRVYPNPFNNYIVFNGVVSNQTTLLISITSLTGMKVMEFQTKDIHQGAFNIRVDFQSMLPEGMYIYRIQTELNKGTAYHRGKLLHVR